MVAQGFGDRLGDRYNQEETAFSLERKQVPSLINWPVFGLKVGLAAALSVHLDSLFGFHDAVSAGFVAVVCTSPTVFTGMKRALEQLAGSLLGGLVATLFLYFGFDGALAAGLAVGISAYLSGLLKMPSAHIVAGFAALFVVILGAENPTTSCFTHLGAVAIGGGTAMLMNLLISALLYRILFTRRMRILREELASTLGSAQLGEDRFDPLFTLIGNIEGELGDASREILVRWLGVKPLIEGFQEEVLLIKEVAHFGKDTILHQEASSLFESSRAAMRGQFTTIDADHPLLAATQRWSDHVRKLRIS